MPSSPQKIHNQFMIQISGSQTKNRIERFVGSLSQAGHELNFSVSSLYGLIFSVSSARLLDQISNLLPRTCGYVDLLPGVERLLYPSRSSVSSTRPPLQKHHVPHLEATMPSHRSRRSLMQENRGLFLTVIISSSPLPFHMPQPL